MPRADQNVIDRIGLRKFQNGRRRIDALEHVRGQPVFIQFDRRGPVLERDQAVDLLVVAVRVEREIDGDAALA